ncbi:MAG: hypothetical protein M1814_002983 [Vezdaea aestivalis]|nr:MAG: hypothetical protein M1814_002983 [Vezdaea aestivalis]
MNSKPNYVFSVEKDRTITQAESVLNAFRHTFSRRKYLSFQGQSRMPKGRKDENNVSPGANANSLVNGKKSPQPPKESDGDASERQVRDSLAELLSHGEPIKRLASILMLLSKTTLSDDVDEIERGYTKQLGLERQNERLRNQIEAFRDIKNQEMERLRQENEQLKAGKDDCDAERRELEALQQQYREAEVKRSQTIAHNQKDEELRSEKKVKLIKAELESKSKKEIQRLQDEKKNLSALAEKLREEMEIEKVKKEKETRRNNILLDDSEKRMNDYKKQLEKMNSEFGIRRNPLDFYIEKFKEIQDLIESVVSQYFQSLPNDAEENPEMTHQKLSNGNEIFKNTPISSSNISRFLRQCDVRHILSTLLCSIMSQPFMPDSNNTGQGHGELLCEISQRLTLISRRTETIWRVLTLRGFNCISTSQTNFSALVNSTLTCLDPLIKPSDRNNVEASLLKICDAAYALWDMNRQDSCKIILDSEPSHHRKEKWATLQDPQLEIEDFGEENVNYVADSSLCLFPQILASFEKADTMAENVMIHSGLALFADSINFAFGRREHREILDALGDMKKRRLSELKENKRRSSISSSQLEKYSGQARKVEYH